MVPGAYIKVMAINAVGFTRLSPQTLQDGEGGVVVEEEEEESTEQV